MMVAIDPGHGMSNKKWGIYDPGAISEEYGFVYREADIVLQYGLTLRTILVNRGVPVFMTRDDEKDHAPYQERARNAENAGCTMFISLHMNSSEQQIARGTETLYRDDKSKIFAQKLQDAVLSVGGLISRKQAIVQRNDLAVLKFKGLAALIELGFIYDDEDRKVLLNPQKRFSICNAIADAAVSPKDIPLVA